MEKANNEDILVMQRIHWGIFLWPAIFTVLLGAPLIPMLLFVRSLSSYFSLLGQAGPSAFVWFPVILDVLVGLVLFWFAWMAFKDTQYLLTTKRVAFRTGWLLTAKGELPLQNVEAVFLVEPILGRLFGYGTVLVTGTGGTKFPLRFLPEADRFHQQLQQALEAVRSGKPLKLPPTPGAAPAARQPSPPKPAAPPARTFSATPDAYEQKTPREKAWEELTKPLPDPPQDDSRYMPKS